MALIFGPVSGCCNAMNIYNVGGAHSQPKFKSQDDFDLAMSNKPHYYGAYHAYTNGSQVEARGFLEHIGFKTIKLNTLYLSTISGTDLRKYYSVARKAELVAYAKKKNAETAEQLAARSKFVPVAVGMPAGELPGVVAVGRRPFAGMILQERVDMLLRNPDRNWRDEPNAREAARIRIREYYGVDIAPWSFHNRTNWQIRDMIYRRVKAQRDALRR